jgi:chromosome segregation ATPase
VHIASYFGSFEGSVTGELEDRQGNGDVTAEAGTDVRGRAANRITRLEERLGQTRVQLDRAKGRRDELEHLLQRMVDAESSRRDHLKVREAEIERREAQVEAIRDELEQRAALAEREANRAQKAQREAHADLEQAKSQAAHERELRSRLDAQLAEQRDLARDASRQLVAAVERREQLEAGHSQLEVELDEARTQAAAAEQRLTELEREGAQLRAELEESKTRLAELEGARAVAGPASSSSPALAEAEREIERLRAELEAARSEADSPVAVAPEADEQSAEVEVLPESPADEAPEDVAEKGRSQLRASRGSARGSRAPLKDASELPGMSDEELAQTFSAMREAAKLAGARGDREGAKSHRALARAVAEEAAGRSDFGGTKVRGRKRNRALKELAAAREKALELRPLMSSSDQPPRLPAD